MRIATVLFLFLVAAPALVMGQSRDFSVDGSGTVLLPPAAGSAQAKEDAGEVSRFVSGRDAEADLREAMAVARKQGKHVLVEAGGPWCVWCLVMDIYFDDHPDLLAYRKANYVLVKVSTDGGDANARVLARYAEIRSFPHLLVLNEEGRLLVSQDSAALERGRAYDHGRLRAFLRRHAPGRPLATQSHR